jgi:hypothetical protein
VYDLQSRFTSSKDAKDTVVALRNIALMSLENLEMRRPFLKLLVSTRNFKSTDPRDKLYALLGISNPNAMPCVGVDYTILALNLFIQFTKQELVSSSLAYLLATSYVDDVA